MRTTRQIKINKSELREQLDFLAHEAGIVYSLALVTFKRVLRKKNHWLSQYGMQRLIRNNNLHSQSTQGIIDKLYANIKSWRKLRKTNPGARLPKKRKWYYTIPYKESAISVKDGKLLLSNGKGNEPLSLDWKYDKPKFVEISFNDGYILNAVYKLEDVASLIEGDVAGIDLGEVHMAVARTNQSTIIANGKELRSKKRYINKATGKLQARIDKCKQGSRKRKQLVKAKTKMRRRLNNQIKDILHKQTTKLIYALKEDGVKTVAIGDVRDIRQNVDCGKHNGQKIHQMHTGKTRGFLTYKARRLGMTVELINEAYTSQSCIRCLTLNKPEKRNYVCSRCGFKYHRDGVGAINIRQKQMYQELVPVVGDMTPPIGLRYVA